MNKSINKNSPLVVIFGRTNVGKSTLFNRLSETHQALVSDIEGTTRDANLTQIAWQGFVFSLVDTGGIIDLKYLSGKKLKTGDIEAKVQKQAHDYLTKANLILFVVDNKSGLTSQDRAMANYLKKDNKLKGKVLVVANKVDKHLDATESYNFIKLGLGDPLAVSAANGSGTGDLLDVVVERIFPSEVFPGNNSIPELTKNNQPIRVAIVGKPNVGKSSLINSILGYERVITSSLPHTTREPQDTEMEYNGQKIVLVDTAGLSRQGHKAVGLEKYSMQRSLSALRRSDIALFVVDVNEPFTHQDSKIIEEIVTRKASFAIVVNKWDLIKEKDTKKFTQLIYSQFPFATYAPLQFTAAISGLKVNKIMDLVLKLNEQRQIQISDSVLNKLLGRWVKIHKPPKSRGDKYPRVYSLTQTRNNPPLFEVRIGSHDTLQASYLRFIENRLREKFEFLGCPMTMRLVHGKKVHGKAEL